MRQIDVHLLGRARLGSKPPAVVDGPDLLLFELFAIIAKFWTYSGQTLGMQVWCIRVQNADGSAISLWQALLRFVVSIASLLCVGLGFFWSLIDKQHRSWHDIYSNSQLVRIPKKKK